MLLPTDDGIIFVCFAGSQNVLRKNVLLEQCGKCKNIVAAIIVGNNNEYIMKIIKKKKTK